jgi:hypothetical protein
MVLVMGIGNWLWVWIISYGNWQLVMGIDYMDRVKLGLLGFGG